MANPGVGTKFVSVNLNKSYGQPSHHHHHPQNSSSYGSNRFRGGGGHGSGGGGGGGGGGMVVLSRPRSSQKAGPKLSVPPPLNLPSLRKEHEKFDSLGSGGGPAGGGVSGSGSRPTSSGMGWTKPGAIALQEKEGLGDQGAEGTDQVSNGLDGVIKGSSVYMPPSARSGTVASSAPTSTLAFPPSERAPVLRGEDFPSLQAALPSASGSGQRQRDGLNQKQKRVVGDESSSEQRNGSRLSTPVDMRPQLHSSRYSSGNGMNDDVETNDLGGSRSRDQVRKQEEYFPGAFPLVRVNPRSDWADDERDTSHALADRGRDHGFPKSEAYWDRDFDMPRISVLPQKPVHNTSERWGQRDDETGKVTSSEVPKGDPYGRDVRAPSREGREGNSWKSSTISKDGSSVPEVGVRTSNLNREMHKENKYAPSLFRENAHSDFGRRDVGYGQGGKQSWNNTTDSHGARGADRNTRERYGSGQHSRYRDSALQNNLMTKSLYSTGGGRGMLVNDPILNFGKDKRLSTKTEKPYVEDPFMKDFGATGFDGRDPFSGGLLGVVKRKKDVLKQTDFHDPVRESFEAELERVQKMQEQERRRIVEEQERALEQARREEEERARLAREQEDKQRQLEEEAREAAWRAEQERLEAMRKAEEQRIAREEEKRRIFIEEERRKHAAKQKLLELEERIAKRQAETSKPGSSSSALADGKMPLTVNEKDVSRTAEVSDWEDGERMVERITTSASSDSSSLNRHVEMGSRSQFTRDSSAAFLDRGKSANSWRRDAYDNGNSSTLHLQDQDIGHHSPRRDGSMGGRSYSRKEFYGGPGFMPSRTYQKGGFSEPQIDDFSHLRGQRWNLSGDGDQYSRNTEIDAEINDHLVDKFGDVGWGQGRPPGNSYSQYSERLYPNSEADGPYSFVRSRYSMRQPRVLPPPISSMHKTSYRSEIERPGPSAFVDSEMQYNHAVRSEHAMHTAYDGSSRENLGQREIIDVQQENEQKLDGKTTPRCDSQSSLSVSSPPSSPTHLSHDDLDESGESSVLSAEGDREDVFLSGQENEPVCLPSNAGEENMMTAATCPSVGDDEEWAVENNEQLQEQEEYDEDEDGYQEEDEVHEGDDENIDLQQEFEDMHLEEKGSPDMMDNLVLGFNEGVEVGMPSDDLGRSARNDVPLVSSSTVEEQRSFDRICIDGETLQPFAVSPRVAIDSSSRMFQETENAVQDLVIEQNNSPSMTPDSKLLDHVDASSSSGLSSHHPVISSVNLASHSSSQAVTSSVPAGPNQAEVPVKLQFGLFSGPSLIPSPVPAIQIGSIQMPLHLHPQVGPSLSHMHPSQPPLFQFGQLRYTSPISQGVLPLAPQSMSFVQPNVPSSFSFNQTPGAPLPIQPGQDSPQSLVKNDVKSLSADNQAGIITRHLDVSQGNIREDNLLPARENAETPMMLQQGRSDISCIGDKNSRSESGIRPAEGHPNLVANNYNSLSITQESEGQPQAGAVLSQTVTKEKVVIGPKVQGTASSSRGKRYIVAVKHSGSRSYPAPESTRPESSGYQRRPRRNVQRTEFRVRGSVDKKQSVGLVSSDDLGLDDKSTAIGRAAGPSARTGPRRAVFLHKTSKQMLESESSNSFPLSSREIDSASRAEKGSGKELLTKGQNIPQSGEGKLKRSIGSEEAVDAPLQSGIVRVFEQPGIEAPSDEDDFIEVRSKRQMLNDRREQREKEIKAKSRVAKVPRRSRSTSKTASANSGKVSTLSGAEAANNTRPDFVGTEGRELGNRELSSGFNTTLVSQPLAPIGTPALKSDSSQTIRSVQTSSNPVVSGAIKNIGSGLLFDNKTKVTDNVQTSLSSWGSSRINQQVMALTQTQLDEAMNPGQFDSRGSVGNHTTAVSDSSMASSSILTKEKSFSSAASPVNSLLAGEKIQFGAVTSPTILPHSSRAVSHGIGPPGPCRSEVQLSHSLGGSENDCDSLFEKEKHSTKTGVHLEDCEAEAEAAASAVAVAAISSDEIVGNALGTCSVSVSDTKSFGSTGIDGITTGGTSDSRFTCQSRAEESLIVSLPADLSVETPPISLWPPLPSPQNSSSQLLSHFPGGPPSHFPFYEMNPMLGGPVFAFGPHDESASTTQSQSQKSTAPASAPLGTWQQCHSGVDSFYGPPAGFTGPFISPPGGIPGVQGPPHMVVYNHFAPVGQFGQVGLSFMGTTYIPSGKQPDWKHSPASSAMVVGEGEINNLNMVSGQRNPTNMPTPIQHLAPGSPLLPMASPMAMFDVSPFQSSPDMSVQARWPHVPASSLQSVPLSVPLQQQADGVLPSKLGHASPVDQSLTGNRFPESRNSSSSDKNRSYPVTTDATVTQLPDELGLVDPSSSTSNGVSAHNVVCESLSVSINPDAGKTDVARNGSNNVSGQNTSSNVKTQPFQHKNNISGHQYGPSSGYNYHRGSGASQRNSSVGEWTHRRTGFHGRNQSLGAERSFHSSKMKQIYVAKQTSTGSSTVSGETR